MPPVTKSNTSQLSPLQNFLREKKEIAIYNQHKRHLPCLLDKYKITQQMMGLSQEEKAILFYFIERASYPKAVQSFKEILPNKFKSTYYPLSIKVSNENKLTISFHSTVKPNDMFCDVNFKINQDGSFTNPDFIYI